MFTVALATYFTVLHCFFHHHITGKIDFIIMQLCDWALLAITLAEIINAPITEFPLSWLQQVQK